MVGGESGVTLRGEVKERVLGDKVRAVVSGECLHGSPVEQTHSGWVSSRQAGLTANVVQPQIWRGDETRFYSPFSPSPHITAGNT